MLNTWPPPLWSPNRRRAALVPWSVPRRLVLTTSSRSPESLSKKGRKPPEQPALLTHTSTLPISTEARRARDSTDFGSDTSHAHPIQASGSLWVCWARSVHVWRTTWSSLEEITTRSPLRRNSLASARPIPLVPPVTTTFKRLDSSSLNAANLDSSCLARAENPKNRAVLAKKGAQCG